MYHIIHGYEDLNEFEKKVARYLTDGWYLVGGPIINNSHYYQAVAK